MREDHLRKGERYLLQGRLNVRLVTPERVEAYCKGDNGHTYRLGHDKGVWTCSCEARGRCAHLVALMRCTNRPGTAVIA